MTAVLARRGLRLTVRGQAVIDAAGVIASAAAAWTLYVGLAGVFTR